MNYARIFSFNRLMDCDVTRTSNDVGYVADICAGAVHNRVLTMHIASDKELLCTTYRLSMEIIERCFYK